MPKTNGMNILVKLILLLVYVNAVFVFDYYVYDALPRILNALTTFFIFPMVFAGIIMFIGKQLLTNFNDRKTTETFDLPIYYSTIIWLPILIFTQVGIKDYFKLNNLKTLQETTVNTITQESFKDLGFVSIKEVQIDESREGLYTYTSRTKSGETYITTEHFYRTIPIVAKDEMQKITNCWLCINDTEMPQLNSDAQQSLVKGMVIQDPYILKYCKKSVQKARIGYDDNLPILFVNPVEDYYNFHENKKKWAIWFFAIVNFLFVGISLYFMIKSD